MYISFKPFTYITIAVAENSFCFLEISLWSPIQINGRAEWCFSAFVCHIWWKPCLVHWFLLLFVVSCLNVSFIFMGEWIFSVGNVLIYFYDMHVWWRILLPFYFDIKSQSSISKLYVKNDWFFLLIGKVYNFLLSIYSYIKNPKMSWGGVLRKIRMNEISEHHFKT